MIVDENNNEQENNTLPAGDTIPADQMPPPVPGVDVPTAEGGEITLQGNPAEGVPPEAPAAAEVVPEGMRARTNPFTGLREFVEIRVLVPKVAVPKDLVDTAKKPKAAAKPPAKGKAKEVAKTTKGGKAPAKATASKPTGKAKDAQKPSKGTKTPPNPATSLDAVVNEMAALREKFAGLDNGKRSGATGQTMTNRYRYLTLAYSKLSPEGTEAPPKLWNEVATTV